MTEEPSLNSFSQALAGRIQENCFENLDAPIHVIGSENLPAIPLNSVLENRMLPNSHIISKKIKELLSDKAINKEFAVDNIIRALQMAESKGDVNNFLKAF